MAKAHNFLEYTEFPSIVFHRSFWIQASGEPKTTEIFPFSIKVASSSVQELMLAAVTPLPLKYSTWSSTRVSKGDTTTQMWPSWLDTWSMTNGKAWKITDFPKPVGKLMKISFFLSINFANCWCKFKACMPNFDATRLKASSRSAIIWSNKRSQVIGWNLRCEHSQEDDSHTLIGSFPRKECISVWSSRVGMESVAWLWPERLRRRLSYARLVMGSIHELLTEYCRAHKCVLGRFWGVLYLGRAEKMNTSALWCGRSIGS